MKEVFRGSVEECLRHFGSRFLEVYPKGSRVSGKIKRNIADFCGADPATIEDWFFRSNHVPQGERWFKLLGFLEVNGYKPTELERAPIVCQNFSKLIAFGILTSEKAMEMLGYSQVSELFRALRGDSGLSKDREEKYWDFWKARRDELDQAIEKARSTHQINFSPLAKAEPAIAKVPVEGKERLPIKSHYLCESTLDLMRGMLRLLDSGILDEITPEDWENFSRSSNTILRLSSHLSSLSAKLVKPS